MYIKEKKNRGYLHFKIKDAYNAVSLILWKPLGKKCGMETTQKRKQHASCNSPVFFLISFSFYHQHVFLHYSSFFLLRMSRPSSRSPAASIWRKCGNWRRVTEFYQEKYKPTLRTSDLKRRSEAADILDCLFDIDILEMFANAIPDSSLPWIWGK